MQVLEDDLIDPNEMSKKVIKLEYRSWRNSLHYEGLTKNPSKTWDDCEQKVQDVLLNNLSIEGNIEIDLCHRFGKRRGSLPAGLFADFAIWKTSKKFFRMLRN